MNGILINEWTPKSNELIIIAIEEWEETASFLSKSGLKPFRDFIPWTFLKDGPIEYELIFKLQQCSGMLDEEAWLFYKKLFGKLVVFHGYCHVGSVLANMVSLYPAFNEAYQIVVAPRVFEVCHTFPGGKSEVTQAYANDGMLLKQADFFVYQDNPEMNEYASKMKTEYFLSCLDVNCKKIKVARINFSGYFPQANKRLRSLTDEEWTYPLFAYSDHFVIGMCKKGFDEDAIIRSISSEDFIAPERVEMSMYYALMYLKKEEEDADIQVYDYIEKNCRKEQLFAAPGHPHNILMIELANRLINEFFPGEMVQIQQFYSENDIILKCDTLQGQDVPLYPSVIKALNLKNYKKMYFNNRFFGFNEMLSFEEYMHEYIRYVKMSM